MHETGGSKQGGLVAELPPTELMAALSSLLVHDLANYLSIISGNAQLAQMLAQDPQRVEAAVAAVVQASEMAGDLIKRCGDLRRSLPMGMAPGELGELGGQIRRVLAEWPGWRVVSGEGDLVGRTVLPTHWIAAAVREIVWELGGGLGEVGLEVREGGTPGGRSRRGPLPPGAKVLVVGVRGGGGGEFPFVRIKQQRSNLLFLAAHELVSNAGGWFEFPGAPAEPAGVRLWVPMVTDAA